MANSNTCFMCNQFPSSSSITLAQYVQYFLKQKKRNIQHIALNGDNDVSTSETFET
jgi:hypothetical protein